MLLEKKLYGPCAQCNAKDVLFWVWAGPEFQMTSCFPIEVQSLKRDPMETGIEMPKECCNIILENSSA